MNWNNPKIHKIPNLDEKQFEFIINSSIGSIIYTQEKKNKMPDFKYCWWDYWHYMNKNRKRKA